MNVINDLTISPKTESDFKSETAKLGMSIFILVKLLDEVKDVDFRKAVNLAENRKLTKKHYQVAVIRELLKLAVDKEWNLCTKNGFIYVYNGSFWQVVGDEEFQSFLGKVASQMGVDIIEAESFQFREILHKQFIASSYLSTPPQRNEVLINLRNGTFLVTPEKQILRKPQPEDFLKYQLSFDYDKKATCSMFYKYLNRVLPDLDCQKVLAEYLGYLFINDLKLEKTLILYGMGANGKSVFFEIVMALIGMMNISTYSLYNLTKKETYRAELSNKLLNYASEINGKLETSIFKQLVSGEPVEARKLYGDPFIMDRYAKLIFNCNDLPKEVECTNAFFRRFLIVPFSETIPENEQDPDLAKKIIEQELSGIFNWVLDGLKRLLAQKKFTESELIKNEIKQYKIESDSVALFISEEGYKTDTEKKIPLKTIWEGYRTYCHDNGYYPCGNRTFSKRLKSMGYNINRLSQGNFINAKKE